ncbi:hypothetical protein CHS0354_001918 [Potamilus streckersoni]|uniref:Uncharacterized protein n=1 Tax=Potamilus streckersoni TaxID=2493646 RepID=A0AAE0SBP1_9BIVA|nr:hypothetical protein CHS0354_001918 [Potamilus streckersoni]
MIVRNVILPLLIGMLLQPVVHTQECSDTLPQDVLIEAAFLPADNITVYPSALMTSLIANLSRDIQESIRASQADTIFTQSEDANFANYYYEDLCPTYDFLLPFDRWYFYYSSLQMKCFSLQPLRIKWCRTRYCSLESTKIFRWWHRCIQEWGNYYFWAVGVNQKGVWSLRYVKWKLPIGCSCKRYYKYTAEVCKASEALASSP